MNASHDYRSLDPILLSRIRLAAITLLATVDQADFSFIRDRTGATDGNLGSHMKKLVEAGYVDEEKRFVERKPRTTYRLSRSGRSALKSHLDRLQAMINEEAPP
jgi:DNA-binding MarR family transcriptional regulator